MDDKLLDKNLIISAVDNKLNHKNRKSQKDNLIYKNDHITCLLYTSPSPRDPKTSRMPSSA